MRMAETTTDRLTLESRPWVLGIFLVIGIMAMLAVAAFGFTVDLWLGLGMMLGAALLGVMFVVFVRRVIVIFDRPARAVVIRTASLLGQGERTLPLDDILRAEVETSISRSTSSSGGRRSATRTHRTVLVTTAENVPLTLVFTSGNGAAQNAEAINQWLGRH